MMIKNVNNKIVLYNRMVNVNINNNLFIILYMMIFIKKCNKLIMNLLIF